MMKNPFLILLLLFVCTLPVKGQQNDSIPGDSLEVSLLTCSPGTQMYQYYGHTALLVRNYTTGENVVFNYGLFDFNTPHFVLRFLLGQTDYLCGSCPLEFFLANYERRGSGVNEDVLNLTDDEKSRIFEALKENCQPQNATYHYDFFYDNCATRVRDKIEQCIDGKVNYVLPQKQQSVRDVVHEYSAPYAWSLFGQDLLLGAEADKTAPREHQEFAPLYLQHDICMAFIEDKDGVQRPLVIRSEELLPNIPINYAKEKSFPLTPMECCIFLVIVTFLLSAWDVYRKKPLWIYDTLLMLVQGLAGLLITFMFFFSIHPTVDTNWLVLVFNPLPLLFLYWVAVREKNNQRSLYQEIGRVYYFAFLCATYFIPQFFSGEVMVLALCLLMRSMSNHIIYSYRLKNIGFSK